MPPSIRIYVKQKVELGRLTFGQRDMAAIGFVAQREIKQRVSRAIGPNDLPSKPLSKRWSRIKLKAGLRPIRDLRGTGKVMEGHRKTLTRAKKAFKGGRKFVGHMIDNWGPRTVTENRVTLDCSQFAAQRKAYFNWLREPWMQPSPRNLAVIQAKARSILEITAKAA